MLKIAQYILGAAIVFAPAGASAGDLVPDSAEGIMNSCRPDYHRICSSVVPGEGRVARCLLDHQTELSPYCLQSLKIASAAEECVADYERFCPDVPKGPRAFQCLADKMHMLAPGCRRVVAANAPYMQQGGERYGYNGGQAPYRYSYGAPAPYSYEAPAPYPYDAPAPYSRPAAPYAGPDRGDPYAYRDGYSRPREPQGQPYNGHAYPGDRGAGPSYGGYADRDEPRREPYESDSYHYGPGYGGRYAEEGTPRFRSYDDSYGDGYAGPGYGGAPRAPY